jgi:hypothetical protein
LYPYYIKGSAHSVCYVGHKDEKPMIAIGCEIHSLEHWLETYREIGWLETYREIGSKNGYTKYKIEEYGLYLDLFKKVVKLEEV